ncbi:MAG: CBS domain-containing protein [Sandaracinaceae bacterium]
MNVQEIMSRNPSACDPQDTLHRAAQIMWDEDCGCVPVVEADRLVGVVTDRDACMGAYLKGAPLDSIRVGDVMSRELYACGPDADVDDVRRMMGRGQIRRIPVVADGRLVGIVSLNDIARATQGSSAPRRPSAVHVTETLAAICAPRTYDRAAE